MSFQADAFQNDAFQVDRGSGSSSRYFDLVPYDVEPNPPYRRKPVWPIWDRAAAAEHAATQPPAPRQLVMPPQALFAPENAPNTARIAAPPGLPNFAELAPPNAPGLALHYRDVLDRGDATRALEALHADMAAQDERDAARALATLHDEIDHQDAIAALRALRIIKG